MTVTQGIQTAPSGHYRLKNVVRAEAVKMVTLPSTAITLGVTVIAALLITGLVSHAALGHSPGFYVGFDPTQTSLTGMIAAGLAGGVFGALIITGEYSSGTIRASLAATPRRPVLLAAKAGVTAAAVVVFLWEVPELRLLLPRPSHPRRSLRPTFVRQPVAAERPRAHRPGRQTSHNPSDHPRCLGVAGSSQGRYG